MPTPQENANLKFVQDMYRDVLMPLDSSRVDEYFDPGYIQHNPTAEPGSKGLKNFLDWARSVSPNAQHIIKRMFAEGDHVIGHIHVIITPGDRGNAVVDIFRLAQGRIVEHWDVAQEVPETSRNGNGMF